MENASKALLIAGGILLGLLTISLFVYMINVVANREKTFKKKEEAKRNVEWNEEWLAYDKKVLYGNEVKTIMKKASQNNAEYAGEDKYKVTVKVYRNSSLSDEFTEEELNDLGTNIFRCIRMEDTNGTGRIDLIEFSFVR